MREKKGGAVFFSGLVNFKKPRMERIAGAARKTE